MTSQSDKFRIGLFVLGTLAMLVLVLIALGSGRFFSRRFPITTFFEETIQGLEVGSPLKKQGVTIGRITRISLVGDRKLIRVDMEVDPRRFNLGSTGSRKEDMKAFHKRCEKMVAQGLRSRLELSGITGMKYIDLDYFPGTPMTTGDPGPEIRIPSVTSSYKQLENSVIVAAARLAEVDFAGLSQQAKQVLQNVNGLLGDARLQGSLDDIRKSSETIRRMTTAAEPAFTPENIRQVTAGIANLTEASAELKNLAGRINAALDAPVTRQTATDLAATAAKVKGVVDKLEQTLTSFDPQGTAGDMRTAFRETAKAADTFSELRPELTRTLAELSQTLQVLRRFAEDLQQNPAMLLRGRPEDR